MTRESSTKPDSGEGGREAPTASKRGRPRLTEPSPDYLRRRQEVIETAARVFHNQGYESGSLDDVAAALDLRKASLYYYVKSKSQLLYFVFDQAISEALERLRTVADTSDPADRLRMYIQHQVTIMSEERSLFRVFFENRPSLSPEFEASIREKERQYLNLFIDAVKAAVDADLLPAMDPRYGAQAILGMSTWVYKWYDPESDDPAQVVEDFTALVLPSFPRPAL